MSVQFAASLILDEAAPARPWVLKTLSAAGESSESFYTRIEALARLQGRLLEQMGKRVVS